MGFPALSMFRPAHSFDSRGVVGPHSGVHRVLRASSFTQISKPIILSVPVDVVYEMCWKLPVNVEPCQTVSGVNVSQNKNHKVSILTDSSCGFSKELRCPATYFNTQEHSSFWTVVEVVFDHFLRQVISRIKLHGIKSKGQQREVRDRYWPNRDCSRNLWLESHFAPSHC